MGWWCRKWGRRIRLTRTGLLWARGGGVFAGVEGWVCEGDTVVGEEQRWAEGMMGGGGGGIAMRAGGVTWGVGGTWKEGGDMEGVGVGGL